MRGLIIRSPWIDFILQGKKTWEIRGSNTYIRGKVALIKSGSGLIYGTVDLVESRQLSLEEYQQTELFHCVSKKNTVKAPYNTIYAWVFENPELFEEPVAYKHPQGAVIWVKLDHIVNEK